MEMKKLSKPVILLIYILFGVTGGLVLFFSILLPDSTGTQLGKEFGISVFIAGLIGFLSTVLSEDEKEEGLKVVANKRTEIPSSIHDKKNKAKKIEILGVALKGFLREIALDPNELIIDRVLWGDVRLRIAFVHPKAAYLKQRSIEDDRQEVSNLQELQVDSVEWCIKFYKKLEKRYEQTSNNGTKIPNGILQIKLIDFCPYVTIERYDNEIYWGLYTADERGETAPFFLATDEDNHAVFDKLRKHFNAIMNKSIADPKKLVLISIAGKPELNEKLAEQILGRERLDRLLAEE